jgi:hypothetical protein
VNLIAQVTLSVTCESVTLQVQHETDAICDGLIIFDRNVITVL